MGNRPNLLHFLFILVFLGFAVVLRIADPFLIGALRLNIFDTYQRLAPESYDPELPVRIVDIDEQSLSTIGQWPWPRTEMATLVDRLSAAGAAVIAFDTIFPEPDQSSAEQMMSRLPPALSEMLRSSLDAAQSNDARFAASLANSPSVLAAALSNERDAMPPIKAGFAFAGDDPKPFLPPFPGAVTNIPTLDAAAQGVGAINWIPDRDQVVRRVPLFFRVDDKIVPSLTAEALRIAQGAGTYLLRASNASGQTAFGQATGMNAAKIGNLVVPTDGDGGIWLKFRETEPEAFLPAWQILQGTFDPQEVAGRIILIGSSAAGLLDLRATPLDPAIPGVEVHAQMLEHMIKGLSLTRPDYALALELVMLVGFGLILGILLPRVSATSSAFVGVIVITVLLLGGWVAYRYAGLLIDTLYPATALFIMATVSTVWIYRRTEKQRAQVRNAFGFYIAPAVVDEIVANPGKLELGGEVRQLTLMFCDVRSFTTIAEGMTAHELTTFINELLTPLSDAILEHRGTIDKYMGDAIMAFWNAPLDQEDHAESACRAAFAMLDRIPELNKQWKERAAAVGKTFPNVAIGIGINTGECCVGNLGSVRRFDYSAIGDEVNVASRLEGLTKQLGLDIVVGQPTIERNPNANAMEVERIQVKGRSRPTTLYTLIRPDLAASIDCVLLKQNQDAMLAAYRARKWDDALGAIERCREMSARRFERYYDHFAERIAELRLDPPPPDWDGTFIATEK